MKEAKILLYLAPVITVGCTLSRDGTSLFETVQNNPSFNPGSSSHGGSANSSSSGGGGGEDGMSGNGGVPAGGATASGGMSFGGGSGGVLEGGVGGMPQGGAGGVSSSGGASSSTGGITSSGGTTSEGGGGASSSSGGFGGSSSPPLGGAGGVGGQGGIGPADSGVDGQPGCPLGEKDCNGSCVSILNPAYGCGDPVCTACSYPHAQTICLNGSCALGSCGPGYGNCNGLAPDGCELPLLADPKNCGACGKTCVDGEICEGGECHKVCAKKAIPNKGWAECWRLNSFSLNAGKYSGIVVKVNQASPNNNNDPVWPGCLSSEPATQNNSTDPSVLCVLGDQPPGTTIYQHLKAYEDNAGNPPKVFTVLCDPSGFPSSKCRGAMDLYKDGKLMTTFEHPPAAPWSYYDPGNGMPMQLKLVLP